MEKYYVVGLINEEVGKGILSLITDIIRNEFMTTAQSVIQHKIAPATEEQAVIRFENFLTKDNFETEYEDYDDVLYLNTVAKRLIEKEGVNLSILKEVDSVPEDAGYLISMPIYKQT